MNLSIDGRPVFISDSGAGCAPVVLVHGAGMDHSAWDDVVPLLATDRRVLAVDLPGHGGSAGPAFTAVRDAADWLGRVVDALELDTLVLAGHSYGSLIALDLASRRPDKISALALLGTTVHMAVDAGLLKTAAEDPAAAAAIIAGASHGLSRKTDPDGAADWKARILARMGTAEPGAAAADLGACDAYGDATQTAAKVVCPVHLILGEKDRLTPPEGGWRLAEAIKAAAVHELDCGHMMMMERADETAKVIGAVR